MNYLDGTLDLLALDALYSQLNGSIGQNASGMDPTLGDIFGTTGALGDYTTVNMMDVSCTAGTPPQPQHPQLENPQIQMEQSLGGVPDMGALQWDPSLFQSMPPLPLNLDLNLAASLLSTVDFGSLALAPAAADFAAQQVPSANTASALSSVQSAESSISSEAEQFASSVFVGADYPTLASTNTQSSTPSAPASPALKSPVQQQQQQTEHQSPPGSPYSDPEYSRQFVDNLSRALTDVLPPMPDADTSPATTATTPAMAWDNSDNSSINQQMHTVCPNTTVSGPTMATAAPVFQFDATTLAMLNNPGLFSTLSLSTAPHAADRAMPIPGSPQPHTPTTNHADSAPKCTCPHGPPITHFLHENIVQALLRRKVTPGPLYFNAAPAMAYETAVKTEDMGGRSKKKEGNICANCKVSETCLWRQVDDGVILCNACALYYRQHRKHRPPEIYQRRRMHRRTNEKIPSAMPMYATN